MNKLLLKICFASTAALLFFYPLTLAFALNIDEYSQQIANTAGYQTGSVMSQNYLDTTIGKIIAFILGFCGLIFFGLILVSGWQWLTAGGNEDKAKHAKDRVISATIGLLIVMAAYAISFLVYNVISTASIGGTPNL